MSSVDVADGPPRSPGAGRGSGRGHDGVGAEVVALPNARGRRALGRGLPELAVVNVRLVRQLATIDIVLLVWGVMAATFLTAMPLTTVVNVARAAYRGDEEIGLDVLALLWVLLLPGWSWGLVGASHRAYRLAARRDVPRLALALGTSIAALLAFVALLKGQLGEPALTSLIHDTSYRWLIFLVLVPSLLSWGLLLQLPTITTSPNRRRIVHIGLAAEVVGCPVVIASQVMDAGTVPWRVSGLVVAAVLVAMSAAILHLASNAEPRLPVRLHRLVKYGVPAMLSVSAVAVAVGAFRDEDFYEKFLPTIGFPIAALPIAALAFYIYDFLVVGGRSFVRELAAANTEPRATEGLLRRALDDPDLRLLFPHPGERALIDQSGARVEVTDRARLQWMTLSGYRIAAVVWGRERSDDRMATDQSILGVAGFTLERARFEAQLMAVAVDLTESRRRLLDATDRAREGVERDLHDGAQQMLVGLLLSLAARADTAETAETAGLARETMTELRRVLDNLRDLARGIYPATLRNGGLVGALEELAFMGPVAVTVGPVPPECDDLPLELAATAYFVISEALTNVAKHAGTDEAHVELTVRDGALGILVVDAGRGGAAVGAGSGLAGLRERVRARGGELRVRSTNGAGTELEATIPLEGGAARDGGKGS